MWMNISGVEIKCPGFFLFDFSRMSRWQFVLKPGV